MPANIERYRHLITEQNNARREWVTNDGPETLARRVAEEAQELVEAVENFDVMQDAEYDLIGETADIAILLFKFCEEMGIDLEQAINDKLERNSIKYPDHFMSNGWGKEKATQQSKSLYEAMGGDHAFYMWHSLKSESGKDDG